MWFLPVPREVMNVLMVLVMATSVVWFRCLVRVSVLVALPQM